MRLRALFVLFFLTLSFAAPRAADDPAIQLLDDGMTLYGQGRTAQDFQTAIQKLKQAAAMLRGEGNTEMEGTAYWAIGGSYDELSEYRESLDYLGKAEKIFRDEGPDLRLKLAGTFLYEGIDCRNLSLYEKSLEYLAQAEKLSLEIHNSEFLALAYKNEGNVYVDLFMYGKALEYYGRAKKIYDLQNNQDGVAGLEIGEGLVYEGLDQFQKALDSYAAAEKTFLAENDQESLGEIYVNEGNAYYYMKQYENALEKYRKAQAICQEENDLGSLEDVLVDEGANYNRLGRYAEAMDALDNAEKIVGELESDGNPVLDKALVVDSEKTKTFALTGKYGDAFQSGERAISDLSKLQDQAFAAGSEHSAISEEENHSLIFDYTAWAALKEEKPADAFSAYNEGEMRVFEAMVARNQGILREEAASPESRALWDERSDALKKIAALELSIPKIADPAARKAALSDYRSEEDKLASIERTLNEKSFAYRAAFGGGDVPVSKVQRRLEPGAELLEYAVIRGELYAFSITRRDFRVTHLMDEEQTAALDGRIARILSTVTNPSDIRRSYAEYRALASPLSRALLGNGAIFPGARRLIIIPTGKLLILPFEILPYGGKFLVQKYEISYLDEARELTGPAQTPGKGFLGYGGIDYFAGGNSYDAGLARLRRDHGLKEARVASRGSVSSPGEQCDLPDPSAWGDISKETLSEVKAIRAELGGNIETGGDASKTRFMLQAPGSRYIHLATHGWTSACVLAGNVPADAAAQSPGGGRTEKFLVDPLTHSFLLFAGALRQGAKGDDDGYLTPMEVMGMDLRGVELVTLSACESGLGKIGGDEGVFGLRRAFLTAGAENLVLSEWSVPDRETNELMVGFYRSIKNHKSISEAFWEAEKREIGTVAKRYGVPHPYFWGAFVHVGK